MKLQSSIKNYYNGTHRVICPENTKKQVLKKIKHSGLPVYNKIMRIDSCDRLGIPVYAVIHNDKFGNCKLPSWGKGVNDDLAFVSALMERVERYTASDVSEAIKQGEIVYSNYGIMKSRGAISRWSFVPNNLQRKFYSKKKIDNQMMPWVKCFSLSKRKYFFIPANLVFFKADWCKDDYSDTTGLASGNTVEEAVLHGLCEVIERHLQDVIHWNKIKVPMINMSVIKDREIRRIMDIVESAGIELYYNYLTGDFKIPVIRVFGYPKTGPYSGSFAFYTSIGIHPDKRIALLRALTEFAQARVSSLYRINKPLNTSRLINFPPNIYNFFNDIMDRRKTIDFDIIDSYNNDDLLEDIELITDILSSKGCEIFIKELTHPQINIPTVRVIIKGLQPGLFGIGIVDLNHEVARISRHLNYYAQIKRNFEILFKENL